jgi:hypothetical protein
VTSPVVPPGFSLVCLDGDGGPSVVNSYSMYEKGERREGKSRESARTAKRGGGGGGVKGGERGWHDRCLKYMSLIFSLSVTLPL